MVPIVYVPCFYFSRAVRCQVTSMFGCLGWGGGSLFGCFLSLLALNSVLRSVEKLNVVFLLYLCLGFVSMVKICPRTRIYPTYVLYVFFLNRRNIFQAIPIWRGYVNTGKALVILHCLRGVLWPNSVTWSWHHKVIIGWATYLYLKIRSFKFVHLVRHMMVWGYIHIWVFHKMVVPNNHWFSY